MNNNIEGTPILKLPMHQGAFCQFLFRWIYYYSWNKSTGKKIDKTHFCALWARMQEGSQPFSI